MEKCEDASKTFCKFCLDVVNDGNYKIIDDIVKEVLNVLQRKLIQSEHDNKPVICDGCSAKLFAAYNFKARCIDIEDCICPYVNSENGSPVDLREIYLKERGKERLKDIFEDERICRLCMQAVASEFISVEDMDMDTLCIYIPEANFRSTKDPVICAVCHESLDTHMTFLKNCLNVKEEFKNVSDYKIPDSPHGIVKEEIEIKSEDDVGTSSSLKEEPLALTSECLSESERTTSNSMPNRKKKPSENKISKLKQINSLDKQIYECDSCDYKTGKRYNLRIHQRRHNPENWKFKCDSCEYKTINKNILKQHQRRHEDIPDEQMFKCDLCDYKTIFKHYLKKHHLRHKETMYKCDCCEYKTGKKSNFARHQLKHEECSELQLYKCHSCDYIIDNRDHFRNHQIKHRSEDQIYKCHSCEYKTFYKRYITQHQVKHMKKMYLCDLCDYKTIYKNQLKFHQHRHKDKLESFKCDSCDYKTFFKQYLKRHQLKHKDIPEDQMYHCNFCEYKTGAKSAFSKHHRNHDLVDQMYSEYKILYKRYITYRVKPTKKTYHCESCKFKTAYRNRFRQHQRRHEDIPEEQMFKCDLCDYKSIFKEYLRRHQLRHKGISKDQSYKCDTCEFKTAYKSHFVAHLRRHKDIPEDQMFKCDSCDYKAIFKQYLKRHQLKHKKFTEEQIYKCESCDYKSGIKWYLKKHQRRHKSKD